MTPFRNFKVFRAFYDLYSIPIDTFIDHIDILTEQDTKKKTIRI